MKRLFALVVCSALLASCGKQTLTPAASSAAASPTAGASVSAFAGRPELSSPEAQALLRSNASDPALLVTLQEIYGQRGPLTEAEALRLQNVSAGTLGEQTLLSPKLALALKIATASANEFYTLREHYSHVDSFDFNWHSVSCREFFGTDPFYYGDHFNMNCAALQFGHRNLPGQLSWLTWPLYKAKVDLAFFTNSKLACLNGHVPHDQIASCKLAAYAYYHQALSLKWRSHH